MNPSIAIVGCGPGGLMLARLLHQAMIPYEIFDLRSAPSTSAQSTPSGSLDLHAESGQRALQVAGLHEAFLKLTRPGGEDMIVADKRGQILFADSGSGDGSESRPEIDRAQLTHLLLSSIPGDNINWDHKVVSISTAGSNRWTLNFENHKPLTFDLVIGADGAWSRIREAVTDVKPSYSGVHCVTLTVPQISSLPALAKLVGNGNYFACSDGKALIAQRGSTDSVRVYALLSSPSETYLSAIDPPLDSMPVSEIKHQLISDPKYFADWESDLKALIGAASECRDLYIQPKPLYMLPIKHRWSSRTGVTLLGDAAHLMTPFAGEGVNAAMLDALSLAELIIDVLKRQPRGSSNSDPRPVEEPAWQGLTREYEEAMFAKAEVKMRETYEGLQIIFAEDAPRELVDVMKSHGPPA